MHYKQLTLVMITPILFSISACSQPQNQTQGYVEGQYRYLSSQVSGTLQHLAVTRGETVKKGQLLYQLNADPQSYQLKQAQAQAAQAQSQMHDLLKGARTPEVEALIAKQEAAQANLTYAQKDLMRQQHLRSQGYTSIAALNLAEQNYRSALADYHGAKANIVNAHLPARTDQILAATAAVQAAQDNVQALQWQINQKQHLAPYSGVVDDTYYYAGENIPADEPIVSMIRPEDTFAIFYVSAKVRSHLHIGEKITVQSNESTKKVTATIDYMSTQAMYTPPLIYSEKNIQDLVFAVHAQLSTKQFVFWPGQPVVVTWPMSKA